MSEGAALPQWLQFLPGFRASRDRQSPPDMTLILVSILANISDSLTIVPVPLTAKSLRQGCTLSATYAGNVSVHS